jgi:hypothetical protein
MSNRREIMPRRQVTRKLKIVQCKRCGYRWVPRVQNGQGSPKRCAGCKTKYWNTKVKDIEQSERATKMHQDLKKKAENTPT